MTSINKGTPLRLLHTSDWHLGQLLHGFERSYEHDRFLEWLLSTLAQERIDALLIAGDVFDNANPPATAQRRLYSFLAAARLRMPQLDIVLIAGNHDSAGRLEAPSPVLQEFGIHIVGQVVRRPDGSVCLDDLIIPLHDSDGLVAAWCLAVPFLRPADVPRIADADDAYTAGILELYRQIQAMALERRAPGQALIAMGHCHLVGGRTSDDSERRIVIGGAESLPVSMFGQEVAYAGLGHLHLAQAVGESSRRYCGSPLPLSFAEIDYPHQVLVVDIDGESVTGIRELRVPRSVPLLRIPSTPGALPDVLAALQALELPEAPLEQQALLEVRVSLTQPEPGLRAQVETALKDKHVRLARISISQTRASGQEPAESSLETLERLEPAGVFDALYRSRFGESVPDDIASAFRELLLEETT